MKRILLLIDAQRDLQTTRCLEQITLGLAGDYQFLEYRVTRDGFARGIRQFVELRRIASSVDLVHAWGDRAMRLATLAANKPLLFTPLPDDPLSSIRWLRSAMARRTIHVMPLSSGEDRLLITRGIPPESCSLVRPGIRILRTISRDDDLRRRLGFSPEHKVILLAGESARHADHQLAVLAVTLLAEMDKSYRILLLGTGEQVETVERTHAALNGTILVNARQMLGDDVRFEQLVPAADAGVISAPDRLALIPVLACMAGGLPLVGPATGPVSELLEDHHTALLYWPRTSRKLAQRLLTLMESPILRRKLSDQSRAEAYELYSVSRFLDEMRRIYG